MKKINDLEVYNYCEKRWDYYEERDGGYYPSKHDNLVFLDAKEKFNITENEVRNSFNKISKVRANEIVKNMNSEDKKNLLEKIIKNNKETPWGNGLNK